MIKLDDFLKLLAGNPNTAIQFMLPDGSPVPPHFHITEVGLVRKDFIDCGGTVRSSATCVMQVWLANDLDHRLMTTKLSRIFELAAPVLQSTDLPVEFEYENGTVSQYPLEAVETIASGLLLRLGSKHTACLAPQLCGVVEDRSGCGTSNCC